MCTKTQSEIAREVYGIALARLTAGQKAYVTRLFNAQPVEEEETESSSNNNDDDDDSEDDDDDNEESEDAGNTDVILVKFGRPGVNGIKECMVVPGTTVTDAMTQAGVVINPKKEGVMMVKPGQQPTIAMFNDAVQNGAVYKICPGINSQ